MLSVYNRQTDSSLPIVSSRSLQKKKKNVMEYAIGKALEIAAPIAIDLVGKGAQAAGRGISDLACESVGLCTPEARARKNRRRAKISTAMSNPLSYGPAGAVAAHVAGTRKLTARPARFRSTSGVTTVSHTEYLSTVYSSSTSNKFSAVGPTIVTGKQ